MPDSAAPLVRMKLSYVGTGYNGWQLQPGQPTIQGEIENALRRIIEKPTRIEGAGRTDAGVHARAQVATFPLSDWSRPLDDLRAALNAVLPWQVRVISLAEAPPGFHARRSATGKRYCYQMWNGVVMPPFLHQFAMHVRAPLDPDRFERAAAMLRGRHDFTGFVASLGGRVRRRRIAAGEAEDRLIDAIRTVRVSKLARHGDLWIYTIQAEGFLHKMVRNIAGTLIEVARGRFEPDRAGQILRTGDRSLCGTTAPPQGLFLERVIYGAQQGVSDASFRKGL